MDRMCFIPGAGEREVIENCKGLICFNRRTALSFAEEYLKDPGNSPLYQIVLACMSDGDQVDITFNLRDPHSEEEEDPSGEPIGDTRATFTPAGGPGRRLWEVGRETEPLRDVDGVRCFNAFRRALALSQGTSPRDDFNESTENLALGGTTTISRALSPTHLYHASGIMWYFIDFSMTAPSRDDHLTTPLKLSRPTNAFDALVLAGLLTLAIGAPPLVFGVRQTEQNMQFLGRGGMPDGFVKVAYAEIEELQVEESKIIIVG